MYLYKVSHAFNLDTATILKKVLETFVTES